MTVLEAIQRSADFLMKKGVDSPRLQAELLLAHVLKLPRMQLYLSFERQLTADHADRLRGLVKRRGQREPLQHIVGSTSFCGLEIAVSRCALIPRPETELLAEAAWKFLEDSPSPTVLDFGTGTGCIAIALAVHRPEAQLRAVDVSCEAIELARANSLRHGVADRIQFVQSRGFDALPSEIKFELIVSNPPYIPSPEIDTLQPEVRDYDPRDALDGGADGLEFFRYLAARAGAYLRPGGKLMLEFGDGQAQAIETIFASQNWIVESIQEDYTQRPRILRAGRD